MSNNPQSEHIMQFFSYAHLPPKLAEVSRPFCELAEKLMATLPANPERTKALDDLMKAKDHAVRAFLAIPQPGTPGA